MSVFSCSKYKDIIRLKSDERKRQFGQRFSLAKVADACGVQKSYLSKVLNSDTHLNPDQLAAVCEFLRCSDSETEYAFLLREYETATHPKRRKILSGKIKGALAQVTKTGAWLEGSSKISDPHLGWIFYTDPTMQLVHLFLTIPAYQADLKKIAEALSISVARVMEIILDLESRGLVKLAGEHYAAQEFNLHLEADSPIYRPYRLLQRVKGLEKIERAKADSSFVMTATFAASAETFGAIKMQILELIRKTQATVIAANAEHVYQMNIDLFRWDD